MEPPKNNLDQALPPTTIATKAVPSRAALDARRGAVRALHAAGCFVIPNPWDAGSARYLRQLGFPALATTSAGFAFSQGLLDSETAVVRDRTLRHIADIVSAVDVPVSADFTSGYGLEPRDVAESVSRCVATGRGAIERSRAALRLDSEVQVLRNCYTSLTPREREVMALVVSGLLNKQVGGELGISEITVKAHRGQVMRKMKADSLPHLVTMAGRLGPRSAEH
ncbi:Transcriptional regulatory protein FixJ [Luteitalea pratensis]|uniref:Transcriptional regulatory protein FixJ n=1 Tax=Luteitalea pratensis TaxID=1855912 RepID=A0A143PL35_LUTPR|nr:isocitrate lyase/phosphoenolpyruvate mutase family protein [Luteitalea pratensis]AMY09275.1 Transcriptional regulatory protein FixJ [Luteitalea pratensis]